MQQEKQKMQKIYYRCVFTPLAPLRISNGDGDATDSDLMKDSRGLPFIPGSSVAGVLRAMLPREDADTLFGTIREECFESRVLVSDATLPADTGTAQLRVSRRDGVGLRDSGATIQGAKYDFQVAETSTPYTAILEWTGEAEDPAKTILENLMRRVAGGVAFGARTTRGYGRMQADVQRRAFTFPEQLDEWLGFDPLRAEDFGGSTVEPMPQSEKTAFHTLRVSLEMQGSFSVRVPTTRVKQAGEASAPDHMPLSGMPDREGRSRPVIPGTAWAGAFRHHMRRMLGQLGLQQEAPALDAAFGIMENAGESRRSLLEFSETTICGGQNYTVTRNAVERFTGAPRNTGLYTTEICQGGAGELVIRYPAGALTPLQSQLLAAALIDLDLGLLTVGGESSVGRGRVGISKLLWDGTDITRRLKENRTDFLEEAE
jgi:CRISPR/Cas system CSM-associated protein Csm3 (group 7 of RAMP superfamily)